MTVEADGRQSRATGVELAPRSALGRGDAPSGGGCAADAVGRPVPVPGPLRDDVPAERGPIE